MRSLFLFFSSLWLTIVLLALSILLVFFGTLDQVHWGIYEAQKRYFETLLAVWHYPPQWPLAQYLKGFWIPLPGGYLLGALLVINLLCAHFRYFRPHIRKTGIVLIHGGVVLLIISGFLTSWLQQESQMILSEGGPPVHYSIDYRAYELVLIDRSNPQHDSVTTIPLAMLYDGGELELPGLPLALRTHKVVENAGIGLRSNIIKHYEDLLAMARRPDSPVQFSAREMASVERILAAMRDSNALVVGTHGDVLLDKRGLQLRGFADRMDGVVHQRPPTFKEDEANMPAVVLEISGPEHSLGTWVLSTGLVGDIPPQFVTLGDQEWEIALRFKRRYHPFSLQLLKFSHDRYPGTDIPRNFSSLVVIDNPQTGEHRQTLIYMNHPLRYEGLTFYQASFADEDTTSILQVVRNPGWLAPYIAITLVGVGMTVQFMIHLIGYLGRRRTTP